MKQNFILSASHWCTLHSLSEVTSLGTITRNHYRIAKVTRSDTKSVRPIRHDTTSFSGSLPYHNLVYLVCMHYLLAGPSFVVWQLNDTRNLDYHLDKQINGQSLTDSGIVPLLAAMPYIGVKRLPRAE
jgi:hypothetical protein